MIDIETVILVTLCLVILLLLSIISKKKTREGFQIVNDVPQEKKVETNYLKKILKVVKPVFPVCDTNPKCGDNVSEYWCNKNV
jgi:hypothetical protein